jgi:hypothetical protein
MNKKGGNVHACGWKEVSVRSRYVKYVSLRSMKGRQFSVDKDGLSSILRWLDGNSVCEYGWK